MINVLGGTLLDHSCCSGTFDSSMLVVIAIDSAVWASGFHNSIERSVPQHGWYQNLNSILIKRTRGSDLDDGFDLRESTDPSDWLRIVMITR